MPRLKSYLPIFAAVLMLGQAVPALAEAQLPDFTQLVEQASPAVVNISTTQKLPERKVSSMGQMPDLEGLPPGLRDFFERSLPPGSGGQGGRQLANLIQLSSAATGQVVSEEPRPISTSPAVPCCSTTAMASAAISCTFRASTCRSATW